MRLMATATKAADVIMNIESRATLLALNGAIRDVVTDVAEQLLTESQKRVPVDTGTLKKSGEIRYNETGTSFEALVGYNTDYAAVMEFGRRSQGSVARRAARKAAEPAVELARDYIRQMILAETARLRKMGYSNQEISFVAKRLKSQYSGVARVPITRAMRQGWPPPDRIYQWLKRHGHSDEEARNMTYPVSRTIVMRGIKARRFLRGGMDAVKQRVWPGLSRELRKKIHFRMQVVRGRL